MKTIRTASARRWRTGLPIKTHLLIAAALSCVSPARAAQQELAVDWLQGGHSGGINGLAFSPDGLSLATIGDDSTVKRWSVSDGSLQETLKTLEIDEDLLALAWSPAGNEIAFGLLEGKLEILDLDEGTSTVLDVQSPIRSLAWGQQGKVLLVGSDEPKVLIVSGGAITGDLIGPSGSIVDLAVSEDGLFVAGGGEDTKAYYWKLSTGRLELTLEGHEKFSNVAISPNGTFLATTDGKKVRIWRTSNGNLLTTYDETNTGAHEVEFVDDETLVYATDFSRVRSRKLTTGEEVYNVVTVPVGPSALAYSPAGELTAPARELIAVGGGFGHVELRNARTGELVLPLVTNPNPAVQIAVSPDGTRLLAGGSTHTLDVRDAQTGVFVATIALPLVVPAVPPPILEMEPDHIIFDAVFSADSRHVYGACSDRLVRKWDADTGVEVASFQVVSGFMLMSLALFNDGELAICGVADGTAKVIRLSDGAVVHVLQGHEHTIRAVAASRDGELLATGDHYGHAKLWDSSSGRLVFELPPHRNAIYKLDFSADGSLLASAGADGLVKIWNTTDGSLRHELPHPSGDPSTLSHALSATFAPVGSRIVTISDLEVLFWDAADGSSIDWTVPESGQATDSAWFGDRIAFGRRDGTVLMTSTP